MIFKPLQVQGAFLIEPEPRKDERGFFARTFCVEELARAGITMTVVQENVSYNLRKGTLRGMHLQREPHGEPKIVRCLRGSIWDVAVDIRRDSATFGKWVGETLSEANRKQLYVPPGCAHGFCVLSDMAIVHYKCTAFYDPGDEIGIAYDDPGLAIPWPVTQPLLSPKDQRNMSWADFVAMLGSG